MATLEDFRTLMSYANEDADDLPWDKAMARVLKGEAAMTIMGDWAKGYADAPDPEEYRNAYRLHPDAGHRRRRSCSRPIRSGCRSSPTTQQVDNTKKLLRFFGS